MMHCSRLPQQQEEQFLLHKEHRIIIILFKLKKNYKIIKKKIQLKIIKFKKKIICIYY